MFIAPTFVLALLSHALTAFGGALINRSIPTRALEKPFKAQNVSYLKCAEKNPTELT